MLPNIENIFANFVGDEGRMGLNDEKTEAQKSRDTAPSNISLESV